MHFRSLTVHRSQVELEVPCVHYQAFRGFETNPHGIRNTVIGFEKRGLDRTESHFRTAVNQNPLRLVQQVRFPQLVFDKAQSQLGSVNRHVQMAQDIRKCPDVILMSVRQKDPAYFLAVFNQVRDIGDDHIDPQHLLFREHQPRIDYDDIIPVPNHVHVLPDFVQPTERKNG